MKIFSNLLAGAVLPFRALKLLFKRPKYWKYASASMILNALLYILMFYLLFHFVLPWVNSWLPAHQANEFLSYLFAFFRFIVKLLIVATFILIFVLLFNTIFFAVSSPFLDKLSLKIEKDLYHYAPEKVGVGGTLKGCYISMWNGVWLNAASMFWAIVLFPLSFIIPIAGFVPGMVAGSYFLGLSFIIYSVEHRRMTKKQLKQALKGNRALILGLGLTMYWILFIPFSAILFIPSAVVAGTILYNEH